MKGHPGCFRDHSGKPAGKTPTTISTSRSAGKTDGIVTPVTRPIGPIGVVGTRRLSRVGPDGQQAVHHAALHGRGRVEPDGCGRAKKKRNRGG